MNYQGNQLSRKTGSACVANILIKTLPPKNPEEDCYAAMAGGAASIGGYLTYPDGGYNSGDRFFGYSNKK